MAFEGAEPAVLARSQEAGVVSEGEERAPVGGGDLAVVRELILRAHPDVVPDLVQGASVAELVASVDAARAAYQAIAQQVQARIRAGETPALPGKGAGETPTLPGKGASEALEFPDKGARETAEGAPPKVPAGGGVAVVDLDALPTAEKLKRGVAFSRQPSAFSGRS